MTASRSSRAAKTTPTVEDNSGRCSAMVTLPADSPYHRLRCKGYLGHEGELHTAKTKAPVAHGRKKLMVEIELTWRMP